ncbi:hypothetical protein EDC56_0527 [Sinobacterium caligoides]|uniref:Uncharacterized protein n=1 Tax=Sinobacterium caligoides TaxID=933926 RepID=A0A3N2DYV6_9GAMM|nr:hypothetical protein [Sinobacterium caligoides]ROS05008.1 hypothetical protein EDC56_0527 [Sinobacterium caligoides]
MDWDMSDVFPVTGLNKLSPMRSRFIAEHVQRAVWGIQRENGEEVNAWVDHSDDPIYQIMAEQNFHRNPVARAKRLLMRIFAKKKASSQQIQITY